MMPAAMERPTFNSLLQGLPVLGRAGDGSVRVSSLVTDSRRIIPGYEVAGKTGTTQKIVNGRYSSAHHVASFAGFFPVGDPKLAITVIIDEPQGEGVGYGGKVSAPVFREVAEKCIRWLDLPPVSNLPRGPVADLGR